jgi:hypothetical protein
MSPSRAASARRGRACKRHRKRAYCRCEPVQRAAALEARQGLGAAPAHEGDRQQADSEIRSADRAPGAGTNWSAELHASHPSDPFGSPRS